MNLSDLLGSEVVDAGGRTIGKVHDARLVKDGPPEANADRLAASASSKLSSNGQLGANDRKRILS